MEHILYETDEPDALECIKDRNGEVVLALCRICLRGELPRSAEQKARDDALYDLQFFRSPT